MVKLYGYSRHLVETPTDRDGSAHVTGQWFLDGAGDYRPPAGRSEFLAAVVHHGGAGSTGEELRAGKPTVVCPFFGDQPFWGRRVHALGVGLRPIPQKRLTSEALAEAIRAAVADEGMHRRASELGEKIRAEDGVRRAVEIVEDQLCRTRARPRMAGGGGAA